MFLAVLVRGAYRVVEDWGSGGALGVFGGAGPLADVFL